MTDAPSPSPLSSGKTLEDLAAARIVRRTLQQWPLIAACAVIAAVAAFVASSAQTKQYESFAKVQVAETDLVSVFLSEQIQISDVDPARKTATAAQLFQLPRVRERASRYIGGAISAADFAKRTKVTTDPNSNLVTVTVRDPRPKVAAAAADAMVKSYVNTQRATQRSKLNRAERQVQDEIDSLSAGARDSVRGQGLQERLRQVRIIGALADGGVDVVQAARVASSPVAPRPKRSALLGLLAGLLLGVGVALLRSRLDDRIRDTDELSALWPLPVVGLIPQTGDLEGLGRALPSGSALEPFALTRTNLRYLHVGGDLKSVIVTSALEGEGKSTVTWNLAVAAAMAESRVLVLEADLRRPVLAERLSLGGGKGLSEVLAGIVPVADVLSTVEIADEDRGVKVAVDVVPAGLTPPSPIALLERATLGEVLKELAPSYDLILIDTPPSTVVADALVALEHADGAVVVSRLSRVTRSALTRMRDQFGAIDKPVVGGVVNGGLSQRGYGYGYGYYGADAKASSKDKAGKGKKPATA